MKKNIPVNTASGLDQKDSNKPLTEAEKTLVEIESGIKRIKDENPGIFLNHQELFYRISTNLLKVPNEKFDEEIVNELATIGEYTNSDGCVVLLFDETKSKVEKVYRWHFSNYTGTKLDELLNKPRDVRTLYNELRAGRIIDYKTEARNGSKAILSRIRDKFRINSGFLMPLNNDKDVIGLIGFANYANEKEFSTENIYLIRLFGNLIVYALVKKQNEDRLRETLIEKDKFFGIIAHDLRGPFTGLIGITETLSKEFVNLSLSEIRSYSNALYTSSVNVFKLLENLLEWSRLQRGIIKYNPINLNLRNTVLSTINLLKNNAEQKKVSLSGRIPENIIVYADEVMLESILRNLLTNALKFTDGGGSVSVECKILKSHVAISVTDTGRGMTRDFVNNLFNFNKLITNYGTSSEKGSGLGLVLSKEFVEKNKGNISVKSKPGSGTTFIFTLPLGAINIAR